MAEPKVRITVAAAARADPAVLAVLAVLGLVLLVAALEAVVVRVDRRLLRAQQEQTPLAVLAVRGELQALGVLEPHRLQTPPQALTAVAAAAGGMRQADLAV